MITVSEAELAGKMRGARDKGDDRSLVYWASRVASEARSQVFRAEACMYLAQAAWRRGDIEVVKERTDEALRLAREDPGRSWILSRVLLWVADFCRLCSNPSGARDALAEAGRLTGGDPVDRAFLALQEARNVLVDDPETAAAALLRALQPFQDNGQERLECVTLCHLVVAHFMCHRADEAAQIMAEDALPAKIASLEVVPPYLELAVSELRVMLHRQLPVHSAGTIPHEVSVALVTVLDVY
jgi:hypothetical protein